MFLPPLSKYAVFCKPTAIQTVAYKAVLNSRAVSRALEADSYSDDVLRSITMLRKLCNHPDLLYTSLRPDGTQLPTFLLALPSCVVQSKQYILT